MHKYGSYVLNSFSHCHVYTDTISFYIRFTGQSSKKYKLQQARKRPPGCPASRLASKDNKKNHKARSYKNYAQQVRLKS